MKIIYNKYPCIIIILEEGVSTSTTCSSKLVEIEEFIKWSKSLIPLPLGTIQHIEENSNGDGSGRKKEKKIPKTNNYNFIE